MTDPAQEQEDQFYQQARQAMVRDQLAARDITDARVLDVMGRVPRQLFVPPQWRREAYDDNPLPIGADQTISQPYMVALMTQLIAPLSEERVLEIGVGSGYQTAVLAELAGRVVGLERIAALAGQAEERLAALGHKNVIIRVGDGSEGLAEFAPYGGILVAAAAPDIPRPLIDQLAEGGRLVIPIGGEGEQVLFKITRQENMLLKERLAAVRFVPLIGRHGFRRGWG